MWLPPTPANARTIEHTNLPLCYMHCKICETPQEPHFGAFWAQHVNRKTGEYLALMTQTPNYVCHGLGVPPTILNTALASDIGHGHWPSADYNDVVTGASIFRIRTPLSSTANQARERNYVYNMVGQGAGVVQMEAVALGMANNEVDPRAESSEF
jgi:hypothetical protein